MGMTYNTVNMHSTAIFSSNELLNLSHEQQYKRYVSIESEFIFLRKKKINNNLYKNMEIPMERIRTT